MVRLSTALTTPNMLIIVPNSRLGQQGQLCRCHHRQDTAAQVRSGSSHSLFAHRSTVASDKLRIVTPIASGIETETLYCAFAAAIRLCPPTSAHRLASGLVVRPRKRLHQKPGKTFFHATTVTCTGIWTAWILRCRLCPRSTKNGCAPIMSNEY